MSVFIIIIFLFFFIIVRKSSTLTFIEKNFLSLYIAVWWYSIYFSRLQLFNLYYVKESTTFLLIIHVFTFLLGYMLCSSKGRRKRLCGKDFPEFNYTVDNLLSNKIFIIALLSCTLYVLSKFIVFFNAVVISNAIDIRGEYFEGNLYGPEFVVVNSFVLFPMNCICLLLWSHCVICKRNWQFYVITIFLIVSNSLAGGRLGYFWISLALLFYIIVKDYNFKRYIPILTVFLLCAYLITAYITAARFGGDAEMSWDNIKTNGIELANEQIITYSAAPPVALDYSIEHNFVKQIGGHKYGGLVFASAVQIVYTISNAMGMPFRQPILDYAERIQKEYIENGNSGWNALYTSVNVYYLDSGILGVLLYPFIFGIFFCKCINLYATTRSVWHLIMLCYIFRIVILSIMNLYFTSSFELLTLIIFFVLGKWQYKKRVKLIL